MADIDKDIIDNLKNNILKVQQYEQRLLSNPSAKLAFEMLNFVMSMSCPVYYSKILEDYFIGLMKNDLLQQASLKFSKNTKILHVMSEAYLHGGHTEIVERWILSSCKWSYDQVHSVIITNQKNNINIPLSLHKAVSRSKGKVLQINKHLTIEDKAVFLKKTSLDFSHIILHHHPNDPVPLMAFSDPKFIIPIILFNHCGHKFWLGRSVVDFCIDIEKGQNLISTKKRGITNSSIVNMPYKESHYQNVDIKYLRKEMEIPEGKKIIISMASDYKYEGIVDGQNFIDIIENILGLNSDFIFIGICIDNKKSQWQALKYKFKNRLILPGSMAKENIIKYLKASDLYIDSFPISSYLSLSDAISIGKLPCLSVKTPMGCPPYLEQSDALCSDLRELQTKILFYLSSNKNLEKLKNDLRNRLYHHCNEKVFIENINNIISRVKTNKNKKIYIEDGKILNTDIYHYKLSKIKNITIQNIFGFIEYHKQYSSNYAKHSIFIWGLRILTYKKPLFINFKSKTK